MLVLLLLLAGILLYRLAHHEAVSWERIHQHEQALRESIHEHPYLSFLVGLAIYTLASLIPGLAGKAVFFGWLFGLWSGFVIVSVSLTVAATITFLLSRHLLRAFVRRKFSFVIAKIDQSFERRGPFYLVMLRVLHLPYTLLNYTLGATSIPVRTFTWTTFVGLLPSNFAFVLAGSQLPTLEGVLEAGIWSVVDLRVMAALSVAAFIPLVARQVVVRWLPEKVRNRPGTQETISSFTNEESNSGRIPRS